MLLPWAELMPLILPLTNYTLTHEVHNTLSIHYAVLDFHSLGTFFTGVSYYVGWAAALLLDTIRFFVMNRKTVHFRLLSASNNIWYAWEESIRIPTKNFHSLVRKVFRISVFIPNTATIAQLGLS